MKTNNLFAKEKDPLGDYKNVPIDEVTRHNMQNQNRTDTPAKPKQSKPMKTISNPDQLIKIWHVNNSLNLEVTYTVNEKTNSYNYKNALLATYGDKWNRVVLPIKNESELEEYFNVLFRSNKKTNED